MVWKIYKSNWFFKGKGGEGCGGEVISNKQCRNY